MVASTLSLCSRIFDRLEGAFRGDRANFVGATLLSFLFLGALGLIEAGRRGLLPDSWASQLSTSHFHAIAFVFTVLLVFEIIELVMSLPASVTAAAGKQFEILSLILIRQSFKELGNLSEPITWTGGASEAVLKIFSDATGALIIFGLLGLFYRAHRRRHEAELADEKLQSFSSIKKTLALGLLLVLFGLALSVLSPAFTEGGGLQACFHSFYSNFFKSFYTILIFADVLMVLISLRYSRAYDYAFRYFGFTVAAVMIRLALTAPRYYDAAIGVGTMLFALILVWLDARLSAYFPHAPEAPLDLD